MRTRGSVRGLLFAVWPVLAGTVSSLDSIAHNFLRGDVNCNGSVNEIHAVDQRAVQLADCNGDALIDFSGVVCHLSWFFFAVRSLRRVLRGWYGC